MPENNSNNPENQPTQELSFEEKVMKQFELRAAQIAALQTQMITMQAQITTVQEEQAALRTEMIERFVQLSRLVRDVDAKVAKVEERFEDVSYKLDDFIKEQIWIKREWRELQNRQTAR